MKDIETNVNKFGYLVAASSLSICSLKLIVVASVEKDRSWWVDVIIILFTMAAFYSIKKYLKS